MENRGPFTVFHFPRNIKCILKNYSVKQRCTPWPEFLVLILAIQFSKHNKSKLIQLLFYQKCTEEDAFLIFYNLLESDFDHGKTEWILQS